jgi:mRNA-degrading endonuclease RelE of RelBE toxin-antitoxin system
MPERRCHSQRSSEESRRVSKLGYEPVFAERAAEFILQLPRRRQRQVVALARQLAAHPRVRSDYTLPDESGRSIDHLMIEDYVLAYWIDDAVREVRITDIDDAS